MFTYLEKIKQYSIWQKSFSYVIEKNDSSLLPYHNTRHLLNVFNSAVEIADSMGLDEKEIIDLGVACLFHDINHSGGKLKDRENIEIALDEFLNFVQLNPNDFSTYSMTNIVNMILCTEYPQNRKPKQIVEKIIVDADLLQAFDVDWFLFAVKGLSVERGVSISQALVDQTIFINNIKFITEYAQNIHIDYKEQYIKELTFLKTIF